MRKPWKLSLCMWGINLDCQLLIMISVFSSNALTPQT